MARSVHGLYVLYDGTNFCYLQTVIHKTDLLSESRRGAKKRIRDTPLIPMRMFEVVLFSRRIIRCCRRTFDVINDVERVTTNTKYVRDEVRCYTYYFSPILRVVSFYTFIQIRAYDQLCDNCGQKSTKRQ